MNRELNKEQIERLVQEAMPKVAKRHDEEIISELSGMTHQQLDEMLHSIKKGEAETEGNGMSSAKTTKHHARIMTFVRLAAACAAILFIIIGIEHLDLGGTASNGHASLFNSYYKRIQG